MAQMIKVPSEKYKYFRLNDVHAHSPIYCESESRRPINSWTQNGRKNFVKTIITILAACGLGVTGILFAFGVFDLQCQESAVSVTSPVTVNASNLNNQLLLPALNIDAPQCGNIPQESRQDCWPEEKGTSQQGCEARGCCWLPAGFSMKRRLGNVPWCFYPTNYNGYMVTSVEKITAGTRAQLQLSRPSSWPNDVQKLYVDIVSETKTRLNVKIYDPANTRYEVPVTLNKEQTTDFTDFDVFSSMGQAPLMFADQFLQFGTQLSSKYIYGLGEHRGAFLVSTNWTKMAFWARDEPPSNHDAHGVFLVNSNAMEVEVTPEPSVIYRTTGGILDFYIFTGPSPDNVVQQYTQLIGRPFMPPYWALGFHLCRWGYGGTAGLKTVIKRMRDANMPYDTQWNDIDYMRDHLDWTYDSTHQFRGLPDVVQDLHDHGQHYIMIIDPGISNSQPKGTYIPYDDGLKRNVFIKTPDGSQPIIGKVWPGTTAYPDFYHPNASDYWYTHAKAYHDIVPFDGIWIDMNEPSNFVAGSTAGCPNNNLENPPWLPPGRCVPPPASTSPPTTIFTVFMDTARPSPQNNKILGGNKRSIVISRSTFPTTGVHSGHWLGDNNAKWDDTYYSIPGIMNFNLFGIPLVGADICGFNGNSNPELCMRWMQLGAFYPFMRNHNTIGNKDQDPASFDTATQDKMRDALLLRYKLLPYLYTLFYINHVEGTPVIRPIFFQYPESAYNVSYMVDTQFMWGDALLVTPTTSQNTYKGLAYLPKDRWYDWFNQSYIDSAGYMGDFDLPMEHINLQVRGGVVIPLQAPNVTTTLSRKNPFSLLVTLTSTGSAKGRMYWDDGESLNSISDKKYNLINFNVSQHMLSSEVVYRGYTGEVITLEHITILGVEIAPTSITVNGQVLTAGYTYKNKVLEINSLTVDLLQPLTINWTV
ncbi:LYAG-like protein [Mya arenaria]|uniref:LYAG-like protein n=1 Tax=Mya arenaria TaxID=6604 RepID=A0ABY7DKB5_MYAAR|nr:LYAG-like protein [Mya arenaria]